MNSFGITDWGPASITTTGLTAINTNNLAVYGVNDDGNPNGAEPTVDWNTDVTAGNDSTNDPNWQPTDAPSESAPGGGIYQVSVGTYVYDGIPMTFYLGGSFTSEIEYSNTQGSSTSSSTGGSSNWGISGTIGYVPPSETGGVEASVSAQYGYTNTWETVKEVDYSETTGVSAGIEIESGFSVTIQPGASTDVSQTDGESEYTGDQDNYVIEAGDYVYMAVQASQGSYNDDFATPWIYTGSVNVVLDSNTPNSLKLS